MKVAACVSYVLILMIYFLFDYGKYWGDIYLQLQSLMIACLAYLQSLSVRNTEHERLLFGSIKYIAIADSLYTLACMINGKDFAIYNTNVFAYVMGISIVVILVHIAYDKDKFT